MKPNAVNVTRSRAPIFWLLFGAGGMLAALIGASMVFVTGVAAPLGLLGAAEALSYANMQALASHLVGKALIFAVISLFLWHAGHRLFHSLHDIGIHPGFVAKAIFYGGPLLATVLAGAMLLGF